MSARDPFEADGFAPNQVPVTPETLPDPQTVQRAREALERLHGRPLRADTDRSTP